MSLLLQLVAAILFTQQARPVGAHEYAMSREQLTHEVEKLRESGHRLLERVDSLTAEKSTLSAKVEALEEEGDDLRKEIKTLRQQGADQARTIEQLTQNISQSSQKHAVAFSASFRSGGSIYIGGSSPINFDTVVTNIGNGYNRYSGFFTAPVAGTYGFFLAVKGANIRDAVHTGIYKSGNILARTISEGSGDDLADKGACFVTTHLNVGDWVFARRTGGGSYIDKWYATAFSGFLITAD